jgi:hypothetical protein
LQKSEKFVSPLAHRSLFVNGYLGEFPWAGLTSGLLTDAAFRSESPIRQGGIEVRRVLE